jgi:hypothetical protein
LGEHGAGGVAHRGEQVDLPAVASGAAQRLAVDRDRSSTLAGTVAVGQPGTDRGGQGLGVKPGQGAADRGLARDRPHPVAGDRMAAGSERGTHGLGASATHSAIAAIDRAPAKTAAAATTRMATSGCRRPARVLGSLMVAR